MLELKAEERRALRARAHALNPVVSISQKGLTEAVLKEIDLSLTHHELIKVRVYNDDRTERDAYLQTICSTLCAAAVQHIGKLLVIWRPSPEVAARDAERLRRAASLKRNDPTKRSKRSFQGHRAKD